MRAWINAIFIVSIAAAAPANAQAPAAQTPGSQPQTAPPPAVAPLLPEAEGLTFTPFVDVGFSGDYENSPAGFGAALGYGMNNRVSVEGELSLTPGGEQGFVGEVDSTVWSLSGNVLYHFLTENFTPYVALGLGVLAADTNAEEVAGIADETSVDLAWNWGAGLKTALSNRFGLRGDLRYFTGDDLAPDHWRLYGGVVIRRIGW